MIGPFSEWDFLFAAAAALLITQMVIRFQKIREIIKNQTISTDGKGIDLSAVMQKCKAMFPIETVIFHGKTFHMGMQVRITTTHKRVIEGRLVGKNNMEVLCVITSRYIIAHEIEQIEEIAILEQEK